MYQICKCYSDTKKLDSFQFSYEGKGIKKILPKLAFQANFFGSRQSGKDHEEEIYYTEAVSHDKLSIILTKFLQNYVCQISRISVLNDFVCIRNI